jgi:hypothetical protein
MKRDMEVIRDILFSIEEQYEDVALYNLEVKDYSFKKIAYHCNLLYEAGFISNYDDAYGDGEICSFGVGSITWEGHDYLDKIRSDKVWNKTKKTITDKGLPMIVDVVKDIATEIIKSMVQGAIQGL